MKSYERRLLTSPTKKQSSSEDKIFDSSEALAFYRKMIDKQNIIESTQSLIQRNYTTRSHSFKDPKMPAKYFA